MTQLISATSHIKGLHYLLPLPPGVSPEALELFSFWTYEFRVGHKYDLGKDSLGIERFRWSTAQGRYGAPLIVAGVQHPAPHLVCAVEHTRKAIIVSAPYATTVNNGVRFIDTFFGDPRTEIIVMLYAQVTQIDGESQRNILLTHRVMVPQIPEHAPSWRLHHSDSEDPRPHWCHRLHSRRKSNPSSTNSAFRTLTPLSILAVELLPGDDVGKTDIRPHPKPKSQDLAAEFAAVGVIDQEGNDPLGSNLGSRRILRTSSLTPFPHLLNHIYFAGGVLPLPSTSSMKRSSAGGAGKNSTLPLGQRT